MKKLLLTILAVIQITLLYSQNTIPFISNTEFNPDEYPERTIIDESQAVFSVNYSIKGATISNVDVKGETYQYLKVKGFGLLQQVGAPALPMHNDLILVSSSEPNITITKADYIEYDDILLHPAMEPAIDNEAAPGPEFLIDTVIYSTDAFYPAEIVKFTDILESRGNLLAVVQLCPVQYNPVTRKLRVYSDIRYSIESNSTVSTMRNLAVSASYSQNYYNFLNRTVLNAVALTNPDDARHFKSEGDASGASGKNYIILTHAEYQEAAEMLATLKRQLGYSVEIVSQTSWTSSQVKDAIHSRYHSWDIKPDYFVIIGDHDGPYAVPGEILTTEGPEFASDLYYACFGGETDFFPDIAHGRISVTNASQAIGVIQKIIDYETTPVNDASFYSNGVNCAYFQDVEDSESPDGYAVRRFCHTSENLRDYLQDEQGYTIERIYDTYAEHTPTNYNNGPFSDGQPIPAELLRSNGFAWDGSASDIISSINNGKFYVLHRDHGFDTFWEHPYFHTSHIDQLNNTSKTPIVFSINCSTGKFLSSECFAEKFLRKLDGGAVGVVGAAEESLSGYNDALVIGMFDAIWSDPGLTPDFGTGGIADPPPSSVYNIRTMGDVVNFGLVRMNETWGVLRLQNELYHWFGDPAMRIWTQNPHDSIITADVPGSIDCEATSLSITNCNRSNALVTLVLNDSIIASTQIIGGNGTLSFNVISDSSDQAILTVSRENSLPLIRSLIINNCGSCNDSTFTAETGTVSDNSGPENYFNDLDCHKLIQPPGAVSITLTFTSLNTERDNDFVYVYDGATTSAPLLGSYSGSSLPSVLPSTGGSMLVRFTSNGSVTDQGWEAYYTTVPLGDCIDETFDGNSGVVDDNSGVDYYKNGADCYKWIGSTYVDSIILNFTEFNTESGNDIVSVYDGSTTGAPLLGSFSGTTTPGELTGYSDTMLIHFVSNETGIAAGWSANYTIHREYTGPCIDSTYTAESGMFSDNSGPENYFNDLDCHKLIQPAAAVSITLTFTSFNTELNNDFVYVYDGATTSATLLGSYSGSSLPPLLTSTGGSMLIRFTSNGTVTDQGWEASYTTILLGDCIDESFGGSSGVVDDNSGGEDYKNDADCHKWIESTDVDSITLSFTEFNTESGVDIVYVYDGSTTAAPLLGSFSGTTLPGELTGFSDTMLIHFVSNETGTAGGWSANYTIHLQYTGPCIDETFTSESGMFSDNSGPENYFNNLGCNKLIQPIGASSITLTFTSFNTEQNYDFVYVYDGATTSAPLLGRFSGSSLPQVLTSTGGSMLVRFTSDYSIVAPGWEASYTSIPLGACIYETFSENTGTLDDNSGIADYVNNADCQKLILPASADSIKLNFTGFDTETGADIVYVYDGSTTAAPLLGSYSGTTLPGELTAFSGSMLIRFVSNGSVTAAGWSTDYTGYGAYTGPCIDETFTTFSGILSDNSGPDNYVNDLGCNKLIQPAGAASITLTFTSFNTEQNYDFVYVYDGATTSAPLLGRFSGSSLPQVLTSTGGSMLVRFTSDYSVNEQGWEANYTSAPLGACIDETFGENDGTVDDNSGSEDYRNNADCQKLIQPVSADSIKLNFTEFNTESGVDIVYVYDGSTTAAPLLGSYSGTTLPAELTAFSGSILIRFVSNGSVTAAGWSADYTGFGSYTGPCIDEIYTTLSGILSDNSGLDNYVNDLGCNKLIQPAGAASITLTFTSFNTEQNYDFVYVYDGATTSAPLLGRFSGSSLPPVLTSTGGSMLVRFTSDFSVTEQGWAASYTSNILGACIDETFPGNTGTLDDNSGVADYANNADCQKLIQPASADSIKLNFTEFNTEPGADIVYVYDGSTTAAPLLGSFSGATLPAELTAFSGSMLIRFVSNESVTAAGWSAGYTSYGAYTGPCIDEIFTAESGTLSDNSGPGNYVNNLGCNKLIQPSGATSITLTFTSFNTERNYDFVIVYDGATTSAPLLGTYSGSTLPPVLNSSGGSMLVRFTSDGSVTTQGWEAEYNTSDVYTGPCIDETSTEESGTISDNSGPNNYYNDMACNKLIQPVGASSITMTFTSFIIEQGYDFVYVYDGATTSAPLLGTYTGSTLPPVLISTGGSMLVRFVTDFSVTAQGWEAAYVSSASSSDAKSEASGINITDIGDTDETYKFNVYPNPTQGELTIEVNTLLEEDMILEVVNSSGRIVMLGKVYASERKTIVDMSDLQRGAFIIRLYNDEYLKLFRVLLVR